MAVDHDGVLSAVSASAPMVGSLGRGFDLAVRDYRTVVAGDFVLGAAERRG